MIEITNTWKVRILQLKMLHNRNGTPVLLFFSEIKDPMKQVISAILVAVESNCPSDDNLDTDIFITFGGGGCGVIISVLAALEENLSALGPLLEDTHLWTKLKNIVWTNRDGKQLADSACKISSLC
ncbi:hypothetical protein ACH5RR_036039 [Cinchona calisaya]|uniref:Uncharacterized protein n=1 Tax=Cinchona calisaya TaxID=153742 RepID=A0ABD2Y455_9GENT